MRKEDEQAIHRTLALLRKECQEHEMCRGCKLYRSNDCILSYPPAYFNPEEVITALKD